MQDLGPMSTRGKLTRAAVLIALLAVVALGVWVLFFYGVPEHAGTVPR